MHTRIWTRGLVLAVIALSVWGSSARAQSYINPFLGYNFGGDSGCQSTTGCESPASNLGLALGHGRGLAFEEELLYARDFFGKSATQSTSLVTLMSNLVGGPRVGVLRPYGVIGVGVLKARVTLTPSDLVNSDTNLAWNIGGGLEIAGRHLGVRGDLRQVRTLSHVNIPVLPVGGVTIDFSRASVGLILRF